MRVFISYENRIRSVSIDPKVTVRDLKTILRRRFHLNLRNEREESDEHLSLAYQGCSLQDDYVYGDLSLPPGSTLLCRVEKQRKPILRINCVNYELKIVYNKFFVVWETTVGALRTMIQDTTGIHVSAFRLFAKKGLELFDCHTLGDYGIGTGDAVAMEIWSDVVHVITASRDNDITATIGSLASLPDSPHLFLYQLQLCLFISAHYGYHQLGTQLMRCGAKPDAPVGQHPSRVWCGSSAHVNNLKTPAHEAAQCGRLKCLQYFHMFNRSIVVCKDSNGLTPCNTARRFKQSECFKFLIAEEFRVPSVHPKLSLSAYSRVRQWCDRAKIRARLNKDKRSVFLLKNGEAVRMCGGVGQDIEVNGYSNVEDNRKVKSAPCFLRGNIEKAFNTAHNSCTRTISDGIKFPCTFSRKNGFYTSFNGSLKMGPSSHDAQLMSKATFNVKPLKLSLSQRDNSHGKCRGKCQNIKSDQQLNENERGKVRTQPSTSLPESQLSLHENKKPSVVSGNTPCKKIISREKYVWKPARTFGKSDQENVGASVEKDRRLETSVSSSIVNKNLQNPSNELKCTYNRKIEEQSNDKPRSNTPWHSNHHASKLDSNSFRDEKCIELKQLKKQSSDIKSRSTGSNADFCLKIASKTFHKKCFLRQVQMALAINEKMYRRSNNGL